MTDTHTETRKSMDDVLASIRRIVRAERDELNDGPVDADVVPDSKSGDAPLALTPEMMSADEVAAKTTLGVSRPISDPHDNEGADMNANDPDDVNSELRTARVARFVNPPEPVDDDEPASASGGLDLDEDELRDLIRQVVREELADGRAAGIVRDIIKAELTTGEIGGNISRNVLRLIRSEVAKAKG